MRREKDLWVRWLVATIALGIFSFCLFMAVAPLVYWAMERSFDQTAWRWTADYLSHLGEPNYIANAHSSLWKLHWEAGFACFGVSFLSALFVAAIFYAVCPYKSFEMTHGDVRWAVDKDIRRMEGRRQIGIRGGYVGILGKWKDGKYIRLIEPISVAIPAPPGAGKTAAIVVPSIVESPTVSMIVNDPKPELAEMTSGYRAEIGFVFIIDWSATDKPHEGIFYPRFNFLSTDLVPPANTAERDTYLDAVAKVLIPDTKGGDKYFTDKGRDCLTGFMHYLVSHVNDHRSYEGIPTQWRGMEASLPMLVDWIADAQFQAGKKAEEANREAAANKQLPTADGMKMFLTGLVEQINAGGYSQRAFTSIAPLIDMADKERSGVLGTMDAAMLPFKNMAVKERTSACDFTSMDLRGMQDPDTGEWLPVTLYICVNQAEAQAFANITALLYEVLSRDFLSYGPGERDKRGRVMGPMTICFMMDEFAKLPKSETVLTGPDLGRSKKVSYWLIFQARSQLVKTYSKEDGTIIDSTCGVTVLLAQNDAETAAHYQKTVGKTTIRKSSHSRQAGLSKSANPFAKNESIASEGVEFLRMEDITAMDPGTQLVLPQSFLNRPMKVQSPFFFEDEKMLKKVYNPRTKKGPAPANPLPEHIRLKRQAEWLEKLRREQELDSNIQERGLAEVALAGVQEPAAY
ncbi:type IV secretory system conjugative DNA transfer family protein [Sphingosinicella sp. BN140058]|uniref:type IV secretory system conjugative DNA transfer family protein n=1 Tax=Sphingosinicella sp. BN140058 TaxID=1892855 RepID=UPI0013EA5664|nr:type IV secretory system conjugative DNA transfer family protein [Sphingosinicella sp. BN140058]